jgi:hypothetical protein
MAPRNTKGKLTSVQTRTGLKHARKTPTHPGRIVNETLGVQRQPEEIEEEKSRRVERQWARDQKKANSVLALRRLCRPGPVALKPLQPSYLAGYIRPANQQSPAAQAIGPSRLKGMVRFSLGFMYYKFSVVAYKQGIFVKL